MANSCFDCCDGSVIHFSNVTSITLFRYEDVEFVYVNDKRILNNKPNKKLLSKIFPYYVAIGKKTKFIISEVKSEDIKEVYE